MQVKVKRDRRQEDFEMGTGARFDPCKHIILEHDPWIVALKKFAREQRHSFVDDLFLYLIPGEEYKRVLGLWLYKPDRGPGLFNDICSFMTAYPPAIPTMADTLKPAKYHMELAKKQWQQDAWAEQVDMQQKQDRATGHNQYLQRRAGGAPSRPLPYEPEEDGAYDELADRLAATGMGKKVVQVNRSA